MAKVITLVLLPVCIILYVMGIPPEKVGLVTGNDYGWLTYHFFHGNLLHLFINWYALASVCFAYRIGAWTFLYSFAVACLYPFYGDVPVIGLSGLVFALFGTIVMQVRDRLYYIGFMLASFALAALLTNIAVLLHIWCFALGILWSVLCYYNGKRNKVNNR